VSKGPKVEKDVHVVVNSEGKRQLAVDDGKVEGKAKTADGKYYDKSSEPIIKKGESRY
jgi:hypothetical protein